jgi:hypothetical protein
VRFITKRFIGEYDQTSENKYKYSTVLDGEQMAFEVLDTRSVVRPLQHKNTYW